MKWNESHLLMSDSLRPHELYVACQAPLSKRFSRQEYWSGLLFPSPGDLPNPGIKPWSSALQADSLPAEPPGKPCAQHIAWIKCYESYLALNTALLSETENMLSMWIPCISSRHIYLLFTFIDILVCCLVVLTLYIFYMENYVVPLSKRPSEVAICLYYLYIFQLCMSHTFFLRWDIYLIAFWFGMLFKNMTGSENIHLGADVTFL